MQPLYFFMQTVRSDLNAEENLHKLVAPISISKILEDYRGFKLVTAAEESSFYWMIYNLIYQGNVAFTETTTIRGRQTIYCLTQSKSSRPTVSRCQATVGADEVKKMLDFSSIIQPNGCVLHT